MKQVIRLLLIVALIVPIGAVATAEIASAHGCTPNGTNYHNAGWGDGDVCHAGGGHFHGWVRDILSDGHCVQALYNTSSGGGFTLLGQSCGPTFNFSTPSGAYQVMMRRTGSPPASVLLWTP